MMNLARSAALAFVSDEFGMTLTLRKRFRVNVVGQIRDQVESVLLRLNW